MPTLRPLAHVPPQTMTSEAPQCLERPLLQRQSMSSGGLLGAKDGGAVFIDLPPDLAWTNIMERLWAPLVGSGTLPALWFLHSSL